MSRVLIVTDGWLSIKEPSVLAALSKQLSVSRQSRGAWLDLRLKLQVLQRVLPTFWYKQTLRLRERSYGETVQRLLVDDINLGAPELTEVVLMTLLEAEGMAWEATTYAELAADKSLRDRLLDQCDVVFASTTMLRGLPELAAVGAFLNRPHNRVVAGGALVGALHHSWEHVAGIDLVAVGYGEYLVPSLVNWVRTGELTAPPLGRVITRGQTPILYGGVPPSTDLDHLVTPDWRLAEAYHGRTYPLVHYESVRGCPYRCAFCNYPKLFDDTKFRYKSAGKIAEDWTRYSEDGVQIVNCLDSLFTMPRRRLLELCDRLEELQLPLKWICYARADDLVLSDTVERMKAAGCMQVQIGIESGNQQILDNMDKRCTVEKNLRAIQRCKEAGITSLVSVIVGFPGETEQTLEQTLEHLCEAQPDFYYAAPFSVDVDGIPILTDTSRERFGIELAETHSSAPYWRHDSMDCATTVELTEHFNHEMMSRKASLDGMIFYPALCGYERDRDRDHLLEFQSQAMGRGRMLRAVLGGAGGVAQKLLRWDMARELPVH